MVSILLPQSRRLKESPAAILLSVRTAMRCFKRISLQDFDVVLAREHVLKLKPHPEGVHLACRRFGVLPAELAVVGDYVYDIEAGQKAGALTVTSAQAAARPYSPTFCHCDSSRAGPARVRILVSPIARTTWAGACRNNFEAELFLLE